MWVLLAFVLSSQVVTRRYLTSTHVKVQVFRRYYNDLFFMLSGISKRFRVGSDAGKHISILCCHILA